MYNGKQTLCSKQNFENGQILGGKQHVVNLQLSYTLIRIQAVVKKRPASKKNVHRTH